MTVPRRLVVAWRRLLISIGVAATLTACVHLPPPALPRPALPLPADVASRYAIPGPVEEEVLVPLGEADGVRMFRGAVLAGDERASLVFVRPHASQPTPLVLLLPILAGGDELLWFVATELAQRGYAVAWVDRAGSALRRGQSAHDLEALLRRTIVHDRMVLAWARAQPGVDAGRCGVVGISMGGMIGGTLLAVEPALRAGALILAGGDLADLLFQSGEGRAYRWLEWRVREQGMSFGELHRELQYELTSDPARLGPYIDTHDVLLVGALFDDVVPRTFQDRLWESLGRPERWLVPTGHYSAAVLLLPILARVDDFLQRRFGASRARS